MITAMIFPASEFESENPTLAKGQFGIESDTGMFKIGDKVTAWNDLEYVPIRGRSNKRSDQNVTSSTTLVAAVGLSLPMIANGKYWIRVVAFFTTQVAAGIKYQHRGPASPTKVYLKRMDMLPGGSAHNNTKLDTGYSGSDVNLSVGSTSEGIIELEGYIENGSTAGDFEFAFAQVTSNGGNTTIKAGSYIEYLRIL